MGVRRVGSTALKNGNMKNENCRASCYSSHKKTTYIDNKLLYYLQGSISWEGVCDGAAVWKTKLEASRSAGTDTVIIP